MEALSAAGEAAPTADEIGRVLHDYIVRNFLPGEDPATVTPTTALMSDGVIPSVALVEIVDFIEHSYRVLLEPEDLGVERMDTIERMVALVSERLEVR